MATLSWTGLGALELPGVLELAPGCPVLFTAVVAVVAAAVAVVIVVVAVVVVVVVVGDGVVVVLVVVDVAVVVVQVPHMTGQLPRTNCPITACWHLPE